MPISQIIKKNISKASWIRKMFETGNELKKKYGEDSVFDFTLGNPTSEPPSKFKEVLIEKAKSLSLGKHRYMSNSGLYETREKIALELNKYTKCNVSPDNMIMTVGAAGALNITLKSLLEPQDEVIFFAPYFPEYVFYIENHYGKGVIVETNEDFTLNIENIKTALNFNTKVIILNTPNNPTGVLYSEESLIELSNLLRDFKEKTGNSVYILSDEPYRKLIYDIKIVPQTLDIFDDIIFCTSHSKDLGLPGERIGFAVVGNNTDDRQNLISAMIFCNRTLGFVNAPAFMQRVVAELQDETVDIQLYKKKRDLFYNNLTKFGYEIIKPQGAFYLFVKSPIKNDLEFVEKLLEYNILCVPGSGFNREGYFRLSFCVDLNTILKSLPFFEKAIDSITA
jgi:aspartate aminotransferase